MKTKLILFVSAVLLIGCTLKANTKFSDGENADYNALSNFIEQVMAVDSFSGVVLIAKEHTVFFEKARGTADRGNNLCNNTETKFNIGSAAKMFTAAAIAQLAERGELSFEDTVEKYLDGFLHGAAGKITIDHLLTHTSGLGDIFTPAYMADMNDVDTVEGFMSYITNQPLLSEPGTEFRYSNGGYIVLGAIIEKVSGEDYYSYIRRHITEPLGMINTDFYKKFDAVPNLARGYMNGPPLPPPDGRPGPMPLVDNRNAVWEDNISQLPLIGNPSGGCYSTVGDMLKFSTALKEYTLLSKEYTDLIMSGKVHTPMGEYGYGFEILDEGGYRTVGHSGGAPGISAVFRILTDENYTVVILSNYDEGTRSIQREIFNYIRP
jgi:CubicO group peptidase (beta-lactamase class C family)